ncbi:leucine-rich repeat domain-containing protein [Chamaesiphon sp. OTE_20_metabat_361]|uniref:leucine-rich repeat domain-containing protein n=1 Tax=Chamaesiphon sp. OTE_20_metabat_361 TaxID=2964689 RepID=UPI00286BF808|nr:leucine-rich repeat domain-containing protein [Chamaesiphon sp. OTE_20_metabat_361]
MKLITSKPEIEFTNLNSQPILDLRFCNLKTLPESISDRQKLIELSLLNNQLISIPSWIGNLVNLTSLSLSNNQLTNLPASLGNLTNLQWLYIGSNRLTALPASIGNLSKLTSLSLRDNHLTTLPESIGNLSKLTCLHLDRNQLSSLPDRITKLVNLTELNLSDNQLTNLPTAIGNLTNLVRLNLTGNKLTHLPESIGELINLTEIQINGNEITDLSILQNLPKLQIVRCGGVSLPRRYWCDLDRLNPQWLLTENRSELRRILIDRIGYLQIYNHFGAIVQDTWRQYTLLKTRRFQSFEREPMVLLKMVCPSTTHIHILRVPPTIISAEAAIVWVNQGIHPDEFAVQT